MIVENHYSLSSIKQVWDFEDGILIELCLAKQLFLII